MSYDIIVYLLGFAALFPFWGIAYIMVEDKAAFYLFIRKDERKRRIYKKASFILDILFYLSLFSLGAAGICWKIYSISHS